MCLQPWEQSSPEVLSFGGGCWKCSSGDTLEYRAKWVFLPLRTTSSFNPCQWLKREGKGGRRLGVDICKETKVMATQLTVGWGLELRHGLWRRREGEKEQRCLANAGELLSTEPASFWRLYVHKPGPQPCWEGGPAIALTIFQWRRLRLQSRTRPQALGLCSLGYTPPLLT